MITGERLGFLVLLLLIAWCLWHDLIRKPALPDALLSRGTSCTDVAALSIEQLRACAALRPDVPGVARLRKLEPQ